MNLSKAELRYIKAIYELSFKEGFTRVIDIAEYLNFSKAGVSLAIKKLQTKGLILRDGKRQVLLSDTGTEYAVLAMDKYAVIYSFLKDVLGVDEKSAAIEANTIINLASSQTLCALCRFTKQIYRKNNCSINKNCIINEGTKYPSLD